MLEFFEKNWQFLIFVSIIASFVIHSVNKERKEQEKKGAQKKTEESKKDKK